MSKALIAAIEANDAQAVRRALKGVKNLNRKIPRANKPLLYACEKGADKALEALFEAGAVGETERTYVGESPFAVASRHGQTKTMEKLWLLKQASQEAIEHSLDMAAMEGQDKSFRFIIEKIKPPITGKLFRLVSKHNKSFVEQLIQNGGDINAVEDAGGEEGITALHAAAYNGNSNQMRVLVECGAKVNVRDPRGRTPLMMLAASLKSFEECNERNKWLQVLIDAGKATIHGSLEMVDGLEALQTLLDLGADAALTDNSGNDAIDYCRFEHRRSKSAPGPEIIEMLEKAGAKGDKATFDLFGAIAEENLAAVRAAIKAGADVNRVCPYDSTPLLWADESDQIVELLLKAGADPNKSARDGFTPLMSTAGGGNLRLVKKLIAAGADVHTVYADGKIMKNAYSVAKGNYKHDVADYLKSLGAGKPKPVKSEPLKPGVKNWNDFSELLARTTVGKVAEALAKMTKGKAYLNVYGRSFLPGKRAYVVVRPKGMSWCNVFQIAPPVLRYEDAQKAEAFARELAKKSGAPVLSIEYSDTSDAAAVFRAEPDGKSSRDDGWDRDTLEEMVEAMGDKAPEWARKQLAKTDEDEPSSTERLEMLAEREKFVVAAFGLDCEPGHEVDVDFTGYGADVFDGVAFVTS